MNESFLSWKAKNLVEIHKNPQKKIFKVDKIFFYYDE